MTATTRTGSDGVRAMLMRGGTSKGVYFLAEDLPADPGARDDLLLRLLGSPDARQIDGLGGGHPLTSKVAVVSPTADDDHEADVEYLFLQVVPDRPIVSDAQTCGNLLSGVGPFALERMLVSATGETTTVRIRSLNPAPSIVIADVQTPGGRVTYEGDEEMSGAPFPAAPIALTFPGDGRSIFPTGNRTDLLGGHHVSCIDAGMPVVLVRAEDLGVTGTETPAELEADDVLRGAVERIRLEAGEAMGLGDVSESTVPKISIVSPGADGELLSTRTFIPHRVHEAIGVLGAMSVAAGALAAGTVASASRTDGSGASSPGASGSGLRYRIGHPTGSLEVGLELTDDGTTVSVVRSTVLRTARKLFDGVSWPR